VSKLNPSPVFQLESPLVCGYCSREYTDRHRFEVHVRFHTGETPFKCHICGKGFRDNRKMKLHVGRHTRYRCYDSLNISAKKLPFVTDNKAELIKKLIIT
jgi:uncharacterized Zn-finger protein